MLKKELFAKIRKIKNSNPNNLMAANFSEKYFSLLNEKQQQKLLKIISSGLINPDSNIGAYAMNHTDYEEFEDFFAPIIRAYHSIDKNKKITHISDWNISDVDSNLRLIDKNLDNLSIRVRIARNLKDFPLPAAMSKIERMELENIALKAFAKLAQEKQFGGKYLSLTPGSSHEMSKEEYQNRLKNRQIFKDISKDKYLKAANISADWPYGRGLYITQKEDFLVWIGEEDHLRIMVMQRAADFKPLFTRLEEGLTKLTNLLPKFASHKYYGNITSCPSNLGTAMRLSVHIKFAKFISNNPNISSLKKIAQNFFLSVRGIGGEHTNIGKDGLVDISPSIRLGLSEKEILQNLYFGISELWKIEQQISVNY